MKANGRFLQEAKEPIKVLGEASPPQMPFFTKLIKIVRYYKQFCLARAAENKLEETTLRKHLEFWQIVLRSNTMNGTTKANIELLRDQLQSLADRKEGGHRIQSRTRWMQSGDKMNIHFFSMREQPVGGLIMELYNEDNTIFLLSAYVVRVCKFFNLKLYASPSLDEQ